jgi:N-acetylated-alpha-linked acidic dipeptidase
MHTLTLALAVALSAAPEAEPDPHRWWAPGSRAAQGAYETALNETPDAKRLEQWHADFASESHVAGTPGDRAVIDGLAAAFGEMGLDVEVHEFWAYLSRPVTARLEIVAPELMALPVIERRVARDPSTSLPDLTFGFNAYSGSGDVVGEVVYANYGRKEDFAKLRELGVDLSGKIVVARYGGNYRGYKAKFAEAAGAAGVVIYTDPKDSGYGRGLPYPEGGFANETSIQRGSIKTTPWPGDPLTPFVEATRDAERVTPEEAGLPTIPVQPVGWAAAREILSRMRGRALPPELVATWQGGLPFAYRLEGGSSLRVRVHVEQHRALTPTANVIGSIRGAEHPDEMVVIGCHHDAWGCGAGDPVAGLIVVLEAARSFAAELRAGRRPKRTIMFAAWGAEEHGIIGSTEWCEANRARLSRGGIAYINLDAAAMGPKFGASAAPSLKTIIEDSARSVPGLRAETVFDGWTNAGDRAASFGNLGGGSDHIGFYCHLGIPSCGLRAGGSHGTAYHSNYDTIAWYRHVVGDDYASALMLTRVTNIAAARLANAEVLPLDPARTASDARGHLADLARRAKAAKIDLDVDALDRALEAAAGMIGSTTADLLVRLEGGAVSAEGLAHANEVIRDMEGRWLEPAGMPDRPWFRNLFAANDPDSGYAAWMLPLLRLAIERRDPVAAEQAIQRYLSVCQELIGDERRLAGAPAR